MNVVEKVLYGLQVTAIGLAVVFFGLALLIFFIWIMARIFKAINGKREGKAEEAAARAEITAPAAAEPVRLQRPWKTRAGRRADRRNCGGDRCL